MKLYLVTCVAKSLYRIEKLAVYVVAPEPTIAMNKALKKMKELNYRYTDWVESVELLAGPQYHAPALLLVD